jgi:hypothetical protein
MALQLSMYSSGLICMATSRLVPGNQLDTTVQPPNKPAATPIANGNDSSGGHTHYLATPVRPGRAGASRARRCQTAGALAMTRYNL